MMIIRYCWPVNHIIKQCKMYNQTCKLTQDRTGNRKTRYKCLVTQVPGVDSQMFRGKHFCVLYNLSRIHRRCFSSTKCSRHPESHYSDWNWCKSHLLPSIEYLLEEGESKLVLIKVLRLSTTSTTSMEIEPGITVTFNLAKTSPS